MDIGFSTGCFYKFCHPVSLQAVHLAKKSGATIIEIQAGSLERLKKLGELDADIFSSFKRASLHLPGALPFRYGKNSKTVELLDRINAEQEKFHFNAIILHPDAVDDWDIFKKYDLPILVENMDNRKHFGKTTSDLQKVFSRFDTKICLDVNHIFTNDKSMRLTQDFIQTFFGRISEIHISGYKTLHDPLFKTRQNFIVDSIKGLDVPVIIESAFDDEREITKEFFYIKNRLSGALTA